MAEIKKELYCIPTHLDVDKCKTNVNTNFADRTAMHIKSGLSEVIIEKPQRKDSNTSSSPRLKNKAPAAFQGTSNQILRDSIDKSKELTRSPTRVHARNNKDRNIKKEVYKQLMSVQGSQAKRNKLKE